MKLSNAIIGLAALSRGINAVALPEEIASLDTHAPEFESSSTNEDLFKRKGGGGGHGGGSSSGGHGSSGSGSSGGKGGSSSSGSSSGGRSSGLGSTSNNKGGQTTTGSGARPAYGGGTYYGGGATIPYAAGSRSHSGIVPALFVGAAIGTIAFIGFELTEAYFYPFTHQYYYHNATTNQNETKPVTCICSAYNPCGCDDNGNATYFNSIIGDGSYANLNKSLVDVAPNKTTGNETIYINGVLPNGTTAAGGTESPNAADALVQSLGWWPVLGTAAAMALLL
ncbi:hypothetical protein F5Y16DRAFT_137365 [Xylariaceae sp. FL0255]|nr:hypothetical protein F5Y16DRAFT_137365 [Xylariaceae sp. FL0255]